MECSAATGRRGFHIIQNTSVCAAASGKERFNMELGLFVFVDLMPKCMQTVYLALRGCSEAAIATTNKVSLRVEE